MSSLQKKILYVDDDLDDCLLLKQAINQVEPIEFVYAHNGVEALTSLKEQYERSSLPDLIVLDINMPKMDGNATLKEIREDPVLKSIPLAVFTTFPNSLDNSVGEHTAGVLAKPTDWLSYSEIARKLLAIIYK